MSESRIRAGTPLDEPPEWALLERDLLEASARAIEPVLERYVNDDGSVMWPPDEDYTGIDALDDAYEGFFNWPLFYLLGADDRLLEVSKREFDAITDQFAQFDSGHGHPIVVKEHEQGYDWFHQSEGYLFFYLLCMADPTDERYRDLATRFAGFYLNEDPDVPDLYDEDERLLKSPMLGSGGPAYRNFSEETPRATYGAHAEPRIPWEYEAWKRIYGLPFYDLDGIETVEDLKDPEKARRMGEALADRCAEGDVPQNLGATTMVANAFLYTGEEKYREWVLEYTEAWAARAEANGGVVPDNVDLDGEIGGNLDGKWYGGYYGWTWPHGWRSLGNGPAVAAENAALLTGDLDYLEFLRSQLVELADRGVERDGELHVPMKHGDDGILDYDGGWNAGPALKEPDGTVYQDDGWFEFRPADEIMGSHLGHLWHVSQTERDRRLLERFEGELGPDREYSLEPRGKANAGNDDAWIAYLLGAFPDYPREILRRNRKLIHDRLAFARHDDQDPATYGDAYLQRRNPLTAEGLVQCTLGAPHAIYHGGLQVARVRHFDPERERPGLPEDVAALVTDLEPDETGVELVNLGATDRSVTVQAGAFAQHRFGRATYDAAVGGNPEQTCAVDVDGDALTVTIPGGTHTRLEIETERFVDDPTYDAPWDR